MKTFQENNVPTKSPSEIAIRYGLIGGAVSIIYSLLIFITDLIASGGIGFSLFNFAFSIFLMVLFGVFAIQERRKNQGGYISLGEGFVVALGAMVLSVAISSLFSYIYIQFIDPGMVDKIVRSSAKMMQKFNMPPEEMEKQLAELPKRFELQGQFIGFVINSVFGAILSLICAASMKKLQNNPFQKLS
jgi:hypothetical protein